MYSIEKGRRHAAYGIVLAEPNSEIRRLFSRLVWQVYRVRARDKPRLRIVRAFGAKMMRDLLLYGPFGKLRWVAPLRYLDGISARAWVRSYFDGHGDVHLSTVISKCRVRAKSVNLSGLESLKALLWTFFGIVQNLQAQKPANPNWSQPYELNIITMEDLLKYHRFVGFNHPAKLRRLRRVVELIDRRRA